jgi:AAA+ superfamily predicted ATPase
MNLNNNSSNLEKEVDWLNLCLWTRLAVMTGNEEWKFKTIEDVPVPELNPEDSAYASFVKENHLNYAERLLLMLSLIPHIKPQSLRPFKIEHNEFSLIDTKINGFYLPTGETAMFLLAGHDLSSRIVYHHLFEQEHIFYKKNVLDLASPVEDAPANSGILKISKSYLDLFTVNKFRKPKFSQEFPAHLLTTTMAWEDLILNEGTEKKLEEIKAFVQYEKVLRNDFGLDKHLKLGYRCLFYGPSGTGKSLAATLIGQALNKDVYRIDLSSVISKYIGETSKNLNNLFNLAEDKDWILFFDEGDALFAQRTDTSKASGNANAQYANQDVAFLLQRIENYNGLVIVATNFKQNIDEAFKRRFQQLINFTPPKEEAGLQIWRKNLPSKLILDPNIRLEDIVKQYSFTAASIINMIQKLSLIAVQKPEPVISKDEFIRILEREKMN